MDEHEKKSKKKNYACSLLGTNFCVRGWSMKLKLGCPAVAIASPGIVIAAFYT